MNDTPPPPGRLLCYLFAAALACASVGCGAGPADGGGDPDAGGGVPDAGGGDAAGGSEAAYGTPEVEIVSPADGEVLLHGATVVLQASVSDVDDLLVELEWIWESDLQGVLADGLDAEGALAVALNDLQGGVHLLTLTVTDPAGLAGSDSIELTLNRAPGPETAVAIEPAAPTTTDALVAVLLEEAVDPDGALVVTHFTWRVDQAPAGVSGETVPATLTERGQTWEVTATPSDGHASGPVGQAAVVIGNARPAIASAKVLPSAGNVTTLFECVPAGWVDGDGDPEGYEYAWLVDGEALVGAEGQTLDGAALAKGDELQCVITPHDGLDPGDPVTSEVVPVLDAPPAVAAVTITPTEGDVTTTFTCAWEGLSDPDPEDDVDLEHIWVVNDEALPGTTSTTFSASTLSEGDTVRCTVVPFSGDADGKAVSSETVTLGNAAPVAGPGLVTPAPATEATGVTCVPGALSDPDGDNVAYEIVWYVDGGVVEGEAGATLSGAHYDKGQEVWCEIVPFDGTDHGAPAKSKTTAVIANAPPSLAAVVVTPSEGSKTDTFLCQPQGASDPDPGDTVAFEYEWRMNGATVPGGLFQALVPTGLAGQLTCVVTPKDGTTAGAPVESAPALVTNHPPSIIAVILGPEPANEGTALTCQPQGWADADDDPEGYLYTWARNGGPVPGYTAATLTGEVFDKNDLIVCFATPTDGSAAGPTLPSNTVTIGNTPPSVESATIAPPIGSKQTTFTCGAVGGSDADAGDPLLWAYRWFADGGLVAGADQQTLVPAEHAVPADATLTCEVTPFDGADQGAAVLSGPAVLSNLPPAGELAIIQPSLPTTVDDLTCLVLGLDDPDGDEITVGYAWVLNGNLVPGQPGEVFPAALHKRNDTVHCLATPGDGSLTGPTLTSDAITIVNSPPSIPEVAVGPANAAAGDSLTCSAASADADPGDTVTFTYQWKQNGAVQGDYTGATLPAGVTGECETWTCVVTATDTYATPPSAEASLQIGGHGGGGGGAWIQAHSFDPASSPTAKPANQFVSVEIAATRFALSAAQLPAELTSARVLAAPGTQYTLRVYSDVFGSPGNQIAQKSFTGNGTFQEVELGSAVSFDAANAFWIGLQGTSNYMTVYGDGDGQATANMIYGCDAFLAGECWGSWGWKAMAAFGPPFSTLGDLIISAGLGGGGTGGTCD